MELFSKAIRDIEQACGLAT